MKNKYYIYWIKSSRGTDEKICVAHPINATKAAIEADLENWCSKFGCWVISESVCSYGFKAVKMLPRKTLLKKFDKVCKKKNKIKEEWDTLAAMLNPNWR